MVFKKTCENCYKEFTVRPYLKDKRRFCSRECSNNFIKKQRIVINCKRCGKELVVIPSRKDKIKFCSKECKKNGKRILVYCKNCGKGIFKIPSYFKKCKIHFCSQKCRGIFLKGKTFEERLGVDRARARNDKIALAQLGEKNSMWKGNKVKHCGLHAWIKNNKPKPEFCEECGKVEPYDLANISGNYKRDINDFKWLCRSCHMKFDYDNKTRLPRKERLKEGNLLVCSKCKKLLPLECFYHNKAAACGFTSQCKVCSGNIQKLRNKKEQGPRNS
jgi:endogenous inhibitor of DNA gyrase (YacG/DUF329 family)